MVSCSVTALWLFTIPSMRQSWTGLLLWDIIGINGYDIPTKEEMEAYNDNIDYARM